MCHLAIDERGVGRWTTRAATGMSTGPSPGLGATSQTAGGPSPLGSRSPSHARGPAPHLAPARPSTLGHLPCPRRRGCATTPGSARSGQASGAPRVVERPPPVVHGWSGSSWSPTARGRGDNTRDASRAPACRSKRGPRGRPGSAAMASSCTWAPRPGPFPEEVQEPRGASRPVIQKQQTAAPGSE